MQTRPIDTRQVGWVSKSIGLIFALSGALGSIMLAACVGGDIENVVQVRGCDTLAMMVIEMGVHGALRSWSS